MTESAIDLDFRPARYWEPHEARDAEMEITVASVNWIRVITLYLLARPVGDGIAYDYRCDGDCSGEGEGIVEYVTEDVDTNQPLTLGLLAEALENFFLAADSLEEALDMAWYAGREGTTDPYDTNGLDPDDPEYAYDFAENTYSFESEYYPQLSVYFEQKVAAWRKRKMAQENDQETSE